jgi:hypothetical protein
VDKYLFQMIGYLIVGKTDDLVSFVLNRLLTLMIFSFLRNMDFAIQLNDQFVLVTEKVSDKGCVGNRMLAAKLEIGQPPVTERLP